jgi:transcriptional regulator with XRE-family HTH domain
MPNIFISYAHEDKVVVLEMYEELKRQGFSLWIDDKNLLPGQEWRVEIVKAIRESDVFIACLSNTSARKRGYIQAEFRKALEVAEEMPEGEIFIIPVRLDDCEVPSSLSKWQWLNYFDVDEKEKLFKAIQMRIKDSKNIVIQKEQYFDAGERIKMVRDELGLTTSQFIEILNLASQREYEAIENREKEVPLSLLKKVSDISGVNMEWLKHEKGHRYTVETIYLNPIEDDLAYCASLNPQEYFLTLDKKQLHVGLVAQIGKYRYQVLDAGVTLDFWNWIDERWAIPAFYNFLERLSNSWHDIRGIIIPPNIEKQLYKEEIHFLTARRNADRYGGDLLYDILDIKETREKPFLTYSKAYGGDWMNRVHDYFKEYLEKEKTRNKISETSASGETSTSISLEEELKQTLRGTYDAARKRGYVATYFLQMLEEHGGVETAKRLLAKPEPQAGLFELWELGLLSESMEAVVLQNKFKDLFTE